MLPTWFPTFQKHIHKLKVRKGESRRVDEKNKRIFTLYTIEVQLEGSNKFLPLGLPTGGFTFKTEAERDAIFNALDNPKV